MKRLENKPNVAGAKPRQLTHRAQRPALEQDVPVGRHVEGAEDLQQRGFPAAARSADGDAFASWIVKLTPRNAWTRPSSKDRFSHALPQAPRRAARCCPGQPSRTAWGLG